MATGSRVLPWKPDEYGQLKKTKHRFLKIKLILMFCQNKLYLRMLVAEMNPVLKLGLADFQFPPKMIWVHPENLLHGTICKIQQELELSSEFFLHRTLNCSRFVFVFIQSQLVCTFILAWENSTVFSFKIFCDDFSGTSK